MGTITRTLLGGRIGVSLTRRIDDVVASVYLGEHHLDHVLRVVLSEPAFRFGARLRVDDDYESPLSAALYLGPLQLHVSSEHSVVRKATKFLERFIAPKGYYRRRQSLWEAKLYTCDGELVFLARFGGCDDDMPHVYLQALQMLRGRSRYSRRPDPQRRPERRTLHFAEGAYTVLFTPWVARWEYPRWPASEQKGMEFEVLDENDRPTGIPIPGKGENGWDCDDDALYSGGVKAETVDAAAGEVYGLVMRDRSRRAGPDWTPSPPRPTSETPPPPAANVCAA